jgi:hypothetical protein
MRARLNYFAADATVFSAQRFRAVARNCSLPFFSERVNHFPSVQGISPGGDDSMSYQFPQAVGQNICCNAFVGLQEFLVASKPPQHHVADDQQRPAIAQYLHRSIQRTPRPPFWTRLLFCHHFTLALLTCILQVTYCRLAFPRQRVGMGGTGVWIPPKSLSEKIFCSTEIRKGTLSQRPYQQ